MRTFVRRSLLVGIMLLSGAGCSGGGGDGGSGGPLPATHALSGTVSGSVQAGVTVSLGGAATATTTTNASGQYSFADLADGTYTVTPSLAGHTFAPPSIAVTLAGTDATSRNFVATSAVCPSPNLDVDRSSFRLYDTLCGPTLDGARWQVPAGVERRVSNGAASIRVAVENMEPVELRRSTYAGYAAVAAGARVTTLRATLALPATASRSGGADVRAVVRLVYQPPSKRLLFPGGNGGLMAFEVGLVDFGDGLYVYRQLYHCDDASCAAISESGVTFADPTGFATLPGLKAGTPASYDTTYTAEASLDESTGVLGWRITGGAFGAGGVSGTANPSAYLASAPGWSGIPLAGAGFLVAQLGVSARDYSAAGGSSADVTGVFDDVWVGVNGGAPAAWDDFDGTGANSGPGGFSPMRWGTWGNQSALPSGGSLVQHVELSEPADATMGYIPTLATGFAFPEEVDAMLVDVLVPTAPSGINPSVFLQGRFYNDGTAGGAPYSALGDIQGQIRLLPASDTATFLIFKCITATCSNTTPFGSGSFAVLPIVGNVHTLRLGFDPTTRLFTFGVDSQSFMVDPQVAGPYVTTPAVYVSPAHAPLRILATSTGVSPTEPASSIDAHFNHVMVWSASAPACNALVNSGPTVQWMNVAQNPPIPAGGTPVPGTYHLTEARRYTGSGGASGPAGFSAKEALLVSADTIQLVSLVDGDPEKRSTMAYAVAGNELHVTAVCGDAGISSVPFTASGGELRVYFPEDPGTGEQVYTRQ
jgi:hypothetical protein